MSARYPRIRYYSVHEAGRSLLIRECVSLTFYLHRPHRDITQEVRHALEAYLQAVGPGALGLYVDEDGDGRDLDEHGWAVIQQRFLDPLGARIELMGATDERAGFEFVYEGQSVEHAERGWVSRVTFYLPTEYLEAEGPGRVRRLALELAERLPFTSGQAGLSFLFPEALLGVTKPLHEDAFRYPGLDMPDSYIAMDMGHRVKGAYWLTFLGPRLLEDLGGVEGLRARLASPGTTVQSMEGGRAVVSLSEGPEAGDIAEGRTLPAYRELARVLEPRLYTFPGCWDGFTREDMRRWERRFLD